MEILETDRHHGQSTRGSRVNGPGRSPSSGIRIMVLFDDKTFETIRKRSLLTGKSLATEIRRLVKAGLSAA